MNTSNVIDKLGSIHLLPNLTAIKEKNRGHFARPKEKINQQIITCGEKNCQAIN